MSTALNPKRLFTGPDRPMSADPTSTTSSSIRPSFSSFSSFSSSITSVFGGGRHSRSNSSVQNSGAPPLARPASAAPTQQVQTKWVPRSTTPAPTSQSRSSRHRSTSSASAAAAALSSSAEHPLPPLPPPPDSQRRSSPAPPGEGVDDPDALEIWKTEATLKAQSRYMRRLNEEQVAFNNRVRSARRNAASASSRRRDSLSSGSTTSGSTDEDPGSDEAYSRLTDAHERTCARLKREYEEEMRSVIREEARRRGVSSFPHPSSQIRPLNGHERHDDVLVEDEMADEWTWRPEENGRRPSEGDRDRGKDKWKELVRQEQQVIWETIKRGPTPAQQQQQQPLSSSAGRKVHFAPATPPFADSSNPPLAAPMSATQTQPPSLPRTPHTPVGAGYPARPISAYPSVSNANRPLSPAVTAPGVRPSSARPASPAYTRWIPSTGPGTSSTTSSGQGRTGSNPINIPGRNNNVQTATEGNGSAGKDRPGSVSGSWRDWSTASSHGHIKRDAPTPSPTAANGHAYPYPRTASNSNLQSSMYATVQMHSRTPSSGNLHAAHAVHSISHHGHGRVPSNGNLQSAAAGAGMRRALTPGPVSSASGYARQRTASMNTGSGFAPPRAPSVPPVPTSVSREREREKDRERRKKGVVDDREPDDAPAPTNAYPVKRVQATAGLGSRTSSNRSALVDDDAPVPEAFSAAPVLRVTSSRHSNHSHRGRVEVEDNDDEEIPPPPRRDKGKGKARAPPSPLLSTTPMPGSGGRRGREGTGFGGMYAAQLEDFASSLRRDLGISAEA
ncbi:hypothetical protein ACEPAH_2112 [Sanghuangporus vaninii]